MVDQVFSCFFDDDVVFESSYFPAGAVTRGEERLFGRTFETPS